MRDGVGDFQERHHYLMEFDFKPEAVPLSVVFAAMETARKEINILDYSVSQNTLDNVRSSKKTCLRFCVRLSTCVVDFVALAANFAVVVALFSGFYQLCEGAGG